MLETMVHPYIIGSLWYGKRWPGSRIRGYVKSATSKQKPPRTAACCPIDSLPGGAAAGDVTSGKAAAPSTR